MRNIELRDMASQGMQLKRRVWPTPQLTWSLSISLSSRAQHKTSAHQTLPGTSAPSHRLLKPLLCPYSAALLTETQPESLELWGDLHSREQPCFWKLQPHHCESHWEIKNQGCSFVYWRKSKPRVQGFKPYLLPKKLYPGKEGRGISTGLQTDAFSPLMIISPCKYLHAKAWGFHPQHIDHQNAKNLRGNSLKGKDNL